MNNIDAPHELLVEDTNCVDEMENTERGIELSSLLEKEPKSDIQSRRISSMRVSVDLSTDKMKEITRMVYVIYMIGN